MAAPLINNEVCKDPETIQDKQKVMNKQWWASSFYSVSDTFKFMAGVMLAAGMGIIGVALKDAGSFGEAMSAVGSSPVGLTFLAVAAIATTVAIGSQFLASRSTHDAYFDQSMLNSKHTAKFLVKEMKKENSCIQQEHPQNCRADGKQWSQVVSNPNQPTQPQL